MNYTMLQAYNCDRQKPGEKKAKMPAEKQMYRPDYVKQHFIHYSTITELSEMNRQDVEKSGRVWSDKSAFPDPLSRFGDETNEGKKPMNGLYGVGPEGIPFVSLSSTAYSNIPSLYLCVRLDAAHQSSGNTRYGWLGAGLQS
jgi:hypothetical protein